MDAQMISGILDQAIGGIIAVLLVLHIEKKLDQLSIDITALTNSIKDHLAKEASHG